jgi:endogenous inhibitor of DNA gyrase (YacG/DUF329 family)
MNVNTKKRGGELTSVPVSCPKCGKEGFIRIERLNRGFVCKECKTRFFVDIGGTRVVDGAMPTSKERKKKKEDAEANEQRSILDNLPRARRTPGQRAAEYAERWHDLPRLTRLLCAAVPLLLVLAMAAGVASFQVGGPRLQGLQARARYLGESFGRDDIDGVQKFAASGTARDARRWHDKLRPASWGERLDKMIFIKVAVSPVFENANEACLIISVTQPKSAASAAPAPAKPAGKPQPKASTPKPSEAASRGGLELMTYWVQKDNEWLFDGTRTLKESETARR